MGGQLAYLYLVGPISMEDGRPMTLPEIPLLGFLIIILMLAGSIVIAAILQRKPLQIRYAAVSKNNEPKLSEDKNKEKETHIELDEERNNLANADRISTNEKIELNSSETKETDDDPRRKRRRSSASS